MAKTDFTPLAPTAAINFLKKKGYKIGFNWTDVWKREHQIAFTVAKAMKTDLLQDIKHSLEDALEKGVPFQKWKENLQPILERKGWWRKKELVNPHTGLKEEVQLGSPRRLSIIYDTNVRMAYAAGHWEAFEENKKAAPFLRYVCVMDGRTREEHRQWHNTILPVDHPFWETHYPPNGWRCRCSVIAYSQFDLDKEGLSVTAEPDMDTRGIAAGFDYNVGKDRERHFSLTHEEELPQTFQNRAEELPPVPAASPMPKNILLPDNWPEIEYAKAFLREFGADIKKPVIYEDVTGEPLVIDKGLFTVKSTGELKVNKNGRGKFMVLMARALKDPDEIWLRWEKEKSTDKYVLKRRYIKIYQTEDGSHCLTVFEKDQKTWKGATTFPVKSNQQPKVRDDYINQYRDGFLAYKKRTAR